jgi:hypothetical protein
MANNRHFPAYDGLSKKQLLRTLTVATQRINGAIHFLMVSNDVMSQDKKIQSALEILTGKPLNNKKRDAIAEAVKQGIKEP